MAKPVRKARDRKRTARAGLRRARTDPNAGKLAEARAAYKEALEQQKATAEVLRAISDARGDIQPVFEMIARTVSRLCGGNHAVVTRFDGELVHLVAQFNPRPGASAPTARHYPRRPGVDTPVARAVLRGEVIHIPDARNDRQLSAELVRNIGAGSFLVVPMMHGPSPIGAIGASRPHAGPFPPAQIRLMQTFADQAVIAIENARLFNETKQALERQTAISEILEKISSSPTDITPVLEVVAARAAHLCEAEQATMLMVEGDALRPRVTYSSDQGPLPNPDTVVALKRTYISGRAALERRVINVEDALPLNDTEYPDGSVNQKKLGYRSFLAVPMMREGRAIGVIAVWRRFVRKFSDKHVALVKTFADQAAIGIENVRLLNETKAALERQTATAEILKVIASSPSSVQPVFDAIGRSAVQLVGGFSAVVTRLEDGVLHLESFTSVNKHGDEALRDIYPYRFAETSTIAEAIRTKAPTGIADMWSDPRVTPQFRALSRTRGYRAMLHAPMVRDGEVVGLIHVTRVEPGSFSPHHVGLIETFANQAVIAIENARLFNETKEALEQQTATSEILNVISRSTTDAQPVFETIAQNARRLLGGSSAGLLLIEADQARMVALATAPGAGDYEVVRRTYPMSMEKLAHERRQFMDVLESGQPASAADFEVELAENPAVLAFTRSAGIRSNAVVPALRDGKPIGLIVVNRREPHVTTAEEFRLLETFAQQAVIAIENARLFNETKEALEQQTATAEILNVISRSTTDVQPVFEAIVRSAARLFDPCSAGIVVRDGDLLQFRAAAGAEVDEAMLARLREVYPAAFDPATSNAARSIIERRIVFCDDTEAPDAPATARSAGHIGKFRSMTNVPLVREGEGVGSIAITHPKPGYRLSDQQLALLKTFADQAVIAIENVRLFNETNEALERQTATGDILKVISSSTTDTQPVFEAIVRSAARLFPESNATIFMRDGDVIRLRAVEGPTVDDARRRELASIYPIPFNPEVSTSARAMSERRTNICLDTEAPGVAEHIRRAGRAGGFRSNTVVPLVRDDEGIGSLVITHPQPGHQLNDKQLELLRTFADQAVIAIENTRLFNETREGLEKQTATAEILRVLSSNPADTQPVFDAIARNAARLCGSAYANVFRYDGERLHLAASYGVSRGILESLKRTYPMVPNRSRVVGRVILQRRVVRMEDADADPEYDQDYAHDSRQRRLLGVPLERAGEPVGAIAIGWEHPGPILDRHEDLLRTFADQAVIAIESVRLFNETKEALEQQTAVGEVLRVISQSPADVTPVLEAVASRAARMCDATDARVFVVSGADLQHAAGFGDIPVRTQSFPLNRASATGRAVIDGRAVQIRDIDAEAAEYPLGSELASRAGWRSVLSIPLMREKRSLGAITLRRREMRPFDEKQVALLKLFADQAAIAIENVRLFNETKEALERQTATSDVLRIISTSPGDVEPVLQSIAERAAVLCQAKIGFVARYDGKLLHMAAFHGVQGDALGTMRALYPMDPTTGGSVAARVVQHRELVQVPDVLADADYAHKTAAETAGFRSVLGVPLLREGTIVGAIIVVREQAGAFPPSHVELLKTFADQAAIAIENARLFNETREALERQTATGEILRVIASSPSDVQPVFDAIVQRAGHLADGASVNVSRVVGDQLHLAAYTRVNEQADELLRNLYPFRISSSHAISEAIRKRSPTFVEDFENDPRIVARSREVMRSRGFRSTLYVPIVRGDVVHGLMHVSKPQPGPFPQKWIDILTTFADQAAIAIENVRLFNETKEALDQQKASAEVLGAISNSIADATPVFDRILESCERLFGSRVAGITLLGEDGRLRLRAYHGPGYEEFVSALFPMRLDGNTGNGLCLTERRIVHIPDAEAPGVPEGARRGHRATGSRASLFAPMMWREQGIGSLFISRPQVGPFSDKEINLLRTFADQAVIAIQNARLFGEIQEKSRQLEEASRHKSQFLASMSHELRTPLNAILGFNEMILGGIYGDVPGEMTEPLKDMQTSGKHLLRLINNVLDLAKIEAGRMELALADYSVQDTVAGVHATLRPLAAEKGLEFQVDVPADIPLAHGDGGRITQCLMNLAGNSLKFTKSGRVAINVQQENGFLRYSVTDTGIGIPADKIASLFTEFKQTDATIASEFGGTGLGLSITKKFIEMHGGRIWVESEPGKGSAFRFELPLRVNA